MRVEVWSTILTAAPQAGVAVLLLAIVVVLFASNRKDRQQYASENAELRKEVKDLKTRVSDLEKELGKQQKDHATEMDEVRRGRWEAEDSAAKYRRKLQILQIDPEAV